MPQKEPDRAQHRGEPRPRVLFTDGRTGVGSDRATHPSAIPSAQGSAGHPTPIAAVGPARAPRPAVLFGSGGTGAPPRRKRAEPRVLAGGEVRSRLPCTSVDLCVVEPTATEELVTAALRLVEAVNLDDDHLDDVEGFGAALQEEHARLAEEELAAAGDGTVETAHAMVHTVAGLLRDLDPDMVFGVDHGGFLGALRALAAAPVDPEAAFAGRYPQLRATAASLKRMATDLAALAGRLRALADRHARLEHHVRAHVLAARFLVQHMRADPGLADARRARHWAQGDAMEARLRSLLVTGETLEGGRRSLAASRQRVTDLAATIAEVVNETLPAWHTAYAAALAAARARGSAGAIPLDGLRAAHREALRTLTREGSA